jgi:hypothetical protein
MVGATCRGAPRAGDLDNRVERSSEALLAHAFATRDWLTVVTVEAIPACADRMNNAGTNIARDVRWGFALVAYKWRAAAAVL